MRLNMLARQAKIYVLSGLLMNTSLVEGLAKNTSKAVHSITKNIKAGKALKGVSKDTFVSTSKSYNSKVKLTNGTTIKAGELQKKANAVAANNKRPVKRPLPITDKYGKIAANVKVYLPTSKTGSLKGKTIIINSGHGGYNKNNGAFDPGTCATDAKGKKIEEWYKNKNFTEEIISKLTNKGAKVIYMDGTAAVITVAKSKYKYADAFISIHCNAASKKSVKGQALIYKNKDLQDIKLAKSIEKALFKTNIARKDVRNLGVIRTVPKMPSVLIETGFASNAYDLKNIDSKTYRQQFSTNVVNGLIKYFKK